MTAPDRDDTRAQAGDVGLSEEEREALWRAAMKSIGCDGYGSHGLIANDLHATVARIKADAYAAGHTQGQRDALAEAERRIEMLREDMYKAVRENGDPTAAYAIGALDGISDALRAEIADPEEHK